MAEFRTNPGDRSAAELEREVDHERERLANTIDALKEKASIGNVLEQVVQVVGENGGEVGRNLGRTLRDNPLPALLTGVGLVWLMAGSGRSAHRSEWDQDEDYYRRYGATPPKPEQVGYGDRAYAGSSYAEEEDTYVERAYPGSGEGEEAAFPAGDEDSGPGIRDRAYEASEGVRERAYEAAEGLRERAADFAGKAQERWTAAGDRMRGAGDAVRRRAGDTRRSAMHVGHDARESVDRLMDEQPLVMGALALAIGAAVGGALPKSRTEDRMFGDRASRAKQGLRAMAEEQGRKAKATAGAVAEEARAVAGEAARQLSESMPRGSELVEKAEAKLEDAAARLRDAGAAEADRQKLGRSSTAE